MDLLLVRRRGALLAALLLLDTGCRYFAGYGQAPTREQGAPTDAASPGDVALRDAMGDDDAPAPRDSGQPRDLRPTSPVITQLQAAPFKGVTSLKTTDFSHVLAYRGALYLGPSGDGRRALRLDPQDPSKAGVVLSFSLPKDEGTGGATSSSNKPGPFPGIGFDGCQQSSYECGPDAEDGRGLLFAGTLAGVEQLFIAGGKSSGSFAYIYGSNDSAPNDTHRFAYVDLDEAPLGAKTKGLSAALFAHDRLYLGLPDTGGKRPYLLSLSAAPSYPDNLEATQAQGESLLGHDIPVIGEASNNVNPLIIDSMIDFNSRLYVFNNGGCARATTTPAKPYDSNAATWVSCTPSAGFAPGKGSKPPSSANLFPHHRAFPQVAVFGGRLYAARNTDLGPQLWICAPNADSSGTSGQCDPTEWVATIDLAAPQQPTQDKPAMVMLVATERHLFMGLEHPVRGLVIYRSATLAPTTLSHFRGDGDCLASLTPSCPGLGGDGLSKVGQGKVDTLHDAKVLTFAKRSALYFTAGDSAGVGAQVQLFRIDD